MQKAKSFFLMFAALSVMIYLSPFFLQLAVADEEELFTEGASYPPNVLIIFDNSQSMDADFRGNLVGSWRTGSRMVEAKRAMINIVNKYVDTSRLGLMVFSQNALTSYRAHNAVYFASYEPKSYCPNPPPECLQYCKGDASKQSACQSACEEQNPLFDATYRDEITTYYGAGTDERNKYCGIVYPKTQRYPNPTDTSNYIYYKLPGTFYAPSNQGTRFGYSAAYNANETVNDSYRLYPIKTGTSDGSYAGGNPGQYDGTYFTSTFTPTDEDIALGFRDFGRRLSWYYVGRTWFNNASPGGGSLQVAVGTNLANNKQKNDLLAKLAMKENDETGYMSCSTGTTCHIVSGGLTPTAGTLQTSIDYFKGASSPIQDWCQKNFIIFVTDGLPSVAANGSTGTAAVLMPEVLAKIDALRAVEKQLTISGVTDTYTFNILTYVVGVAMTEEAEPYLDTMAVRGGTAVNGRALYANNPAAIESILDNILSDILSRSYTFSTASISSSRTADENFLYEATFMPTSLTPFWKGFLKKWTLKTDGNLDYVLWDAGEVLKNKSAESRKIKTMINGYIVDFKSSDIDASVPVPYTKMNLTIATPSQTLADKIIKYFRGYATDPADLTPLNPHNWKLGDIYHSNPITLGTPSAFFLDFVETNPSIAGKKAYDLYRDAYPRASACPGGGTSCPGYGKRMIITGANDGQFHAFNATDGQEFWSFIPPNLLPKLQYHYHTTTTSTNPHLFFVDGPTLALDAWLPFTPTDGTTKDYTDWRTLVIFGLGRNDRDYTTYDKSLIPQTTKFWSSSVNCDTGLAEIYNSSTAPHYCGYWAFDFTEAPDFDPVFKWTLKPTSATAPFLGEPWSSVSTGRLKINGMERWVGVIGGGFAHNATTGMKHGRGIIVFDLRNGEEIWSYTQNENSDMEYPIPSKVSVVDTDNDGYIDRAYVGDIKGNMWQLKFCTATDLLNNSYCDTTSWRGSLLLDKLTGSDKYPIYFQPTITKDRAGDLWIFWATGDRSDPNSNDPAAYVYGLKPLLCLNTSTGEPQPCLRNNLANITSSKNDYCGSAASKQGWYINLAGLNEKVLAQPVAFNHVLYFTTFTPAIGTGSTCTKTGTARLYAISIETSPSYCNAGAGVMDGGARSAVIGVGIPSAPLISYGPDGKPGIYYSLSGAGGQEGGTKLGGFKPPSTANRTNLLFWKDKRLEP